MSAFPATAEPTFAEPAVETGGKPVRRPPGWIGARSAIDGLACLAVAVLLLRTFLVEGYMISTGSMAPALYGYHKRVVCPACGEVFARVLVPRDPTDGDPHVEWIDLNDS